jgi:DNA-binding MarR family transcriptional regulator
MPDFCKMTRSCDLSAFLRHLDFFSTMPLPVHPADPATPAEYDVSGYDVSEQIGHLLRKAYQRHLAIFAQTIGDPQLTAVQFAVLSASLRLGPSSMSDLGKATAIDAATVRGIIERLKSRGLIELQTNSDDRRKVVVELTRAGHELVAMTTPTAAHISELTMSDLNAVERVAVLYLLRKLSAPEAD